MTDFKPVALLWDGTDEVFRPRNSGFLKRCHEQFADGQTYVLAVQEDAPDQPYRRAFFAEVNEVFKTLPDAMENRFADANALRKWALVQAGVCTIRDFVCSSAAEAKRTAMVAQQMSDEYAVVAIEGAVVRVYTPKSMQARHMPKAEFKDVAERVRKVIAEHLGVTVGELRREGRQHERVART